MRESLQAAERAVSIRRGHECVGVPEHILESSVMKASGRIEVQESGAGGGLSTVRAHGSEDHLAVAGVGFLSGKIRPTRPAYRVREAWKRRN
jgi:hypothetical protein